MVLEDVEPVIVLGVDVGKSYHYGAAVDRSGKVVWEGQLANDEAELRVVLSRLLGQGELLVVVGSVGRDWGVGGAGRSGDGSCGWVFAGVVDAADR